MDLTRLRYFVHVAEQGSFTRAASTLGIVQPALSRQVRLLESELKQQLLVRHGHGVAVTEAGKRLLDHARGILHQVERAREDLARVDGALASRLVIGLPPSVARILTVALVREFNARLPQASLCINESLSATMREWLLGGRLDIALLYDPQPSPELELVPLMEETLCLVSARTGKADSSPVTLKSIAALQLLLPSRPNSLRLVLETGLAELGHELRVNLEIDNYSSILDVVADGAGHTVLPRHVAKNLQKPHAYDFRLITRPRLHRKLMMASAAARTPALAQQVLCEVIREVTGKVFKDGESNAKAPA